MKYVNMTPLTVKAKAATAKGRPELTLRLARNLLAAIAADRCQDPQYCARLVVNLLDQGDLRSST